MFWWKRMSLLGLRGFHRWNPINIQKKGPAGIHFLTRKSSTPPNAASLANKLAFKNTRITVLWQKNRQRFIVKHLSVNDNQGNTEVLTELFYTLHTVHPVHISRKGGCCIVCCHPKGDSSITSPEHGMSLEENSAKAPLKSTKGTCRQLPPLYGHTKSTCDTWQALALQPLSSAIPHRPLSQRPHIHAASNMSSTLRLEVPIFWHLTNNQWIDQSSTLHLRK